MFKEIHIYPVIKFFEESVAQFCKTIEKAGGLSDQASIKPSYLVSHIFSANYQEMESKSIMGRLRKVLIYVNHFTQQVNIKKTLIKKKTSTF